MGYPRVTHLNLPNSPLIIPKTDHNSACSTPNTTTIVSTAPSNPTALLALDHGGFETNGNEQSEQQPLGSSRWNPTPEQLVALEEVYRRGTRTPSASQIQQIATRLRRFGKIEGKNVFYWFQNHKARERQKRRRQVETDQPPPPPPPPQQQQCDDTESLEKRETTSCEIEQTRNKGPPSSLSKLSEEFISMNGVVAAETAKSGPIYLINTMTETSLDGRSLVNTQNLCSIFKTHQENITTLEDENREDQTLELFPLGSHDCNGINISKKVDTQVPIRAINTTFTPIQYYEFLPLKN
ncbi:hypothetical protein PTKIN_Ptkin02bG0054900 [Pterospermum kingtungense]